ncbi:Crp/Fnr family transcriptional regulator [Tianweitania sediminis]|jgi:CRP-like cAMP-binding protein|uniref:Crp/Fnr family transcriptional regulator n=1 Tax=Tianweitania sediminis TaxID=1502156 RepID=A0A8J7UM06_9HYPH|nr:Crp/Fnr family transcriptional regulator [Tianweitania sediminis]MBP0441314.1 Crp/Fnr family transcriptional regulator [Tianweitania sediminis]HEV7416225.1 Crp/Fnr family transcriptional regulator [Tianweitania sediminis]
MVRSLIWAKELGEPELEIAAKGLSERFYPKNSYICHRGDRLDSWTGVVTGLVKMSAVSLSGKATTFVGVGAGGWLGEGSMLKNEERKYDLVALRDTRLLMMNKATFMALCENSVGFNRFLVRQLNERLGQFVAITEHDRSFDAKARVARNLSWLCNPVLSPQVGGVLEITQEEVGLLAGISRQVANRCLKELADEGLIDLQPGAIRPLDLEALSNYGSG